MKTEINRIELTKEQAEKLKEKYADLIPSNAPELGGQAPSGEKCPHCGAEMPRICFILGSTLCITPHDTGCTCPEANAEREAKEAQRKKEQAEAEAKERAEKIELMQKRAGMGDRERRKTFDTMEQTPDNFSAILEAKEYAAAYTNKTQREKSSLYICGDLGTGKTHLAAAIANKIIQHGRAVKFTTFSRMLQDIRSAFYAESRETEAEAVKRYQNAPILFIDDLGKEKPTEWNIALLFSLIDFRYCNGLPTVITSNYTLDDLADKLTPPMGDKMTAEAITDRLWEECQQIRINGQSWRRR